MSKGKYDEHLISQVRSRIPSKARIVSELHDKLQATVALLEESYKLAMKIANEMLDRYGKDEIDFRSWAYDYGFCCSVTYDGGRHPEYDSNAFSDVLGFGRDSDGELYLIIDDCDHYEISRTNHDEFAWFIDQFSDSFEDFLEHENED